MQAIPEVERSRLSVLVLVALAAFLVGMAAGQIGAERSPVRSRIDWPVPAHPRSLQP
jgi:hypothetical protein